MSDSGFSVKIKNEKKMYFRLIPSREEKIRYWTKRLRKVKTQEIKERCELELKRLEEEGEVLPSEKTSPELKDQPSD